MGEKQDPQNAGKGARQRGDDDERISPRLKIDDHQKINQHGRENETEAKFAERGVHAFNLTAHGDRAARREFRTKFVHDFRDLVRNAAKIGALHVCVNVEHRLHVGMTNDRRRFRAIERDDVAEQLRMRRIFAGQ